MNLPFKAKTTTVIWYKDLQDFLKEEYKAEFDILLPGEYNNGSYIDIDAVWLPTTAEYTKLREELEEEFESGLIQWPDWELIFGDLVYRGRIPQGKYLITIWW